jgi:transposase
MVCIEAKHKGAVKMHTKSLVKRLLKIDRVAITDVRFETVNEEEHLVVSARPYVRDTFRCPYCGKRCKGYDSYGKVRRWRSLDLGSTKVYIEAAAPRIQCPKHGVLVAKVPWARHNSDYTYDFETTVTWLTLHATAQDVAEYFRIKWHTVGSIARRVQESLEKEETNRFENLEAIGIDETSYKKGHKYMTVIVNHKTGALIWAKKGYGKEILTGFFKGLTEEQRAKIKYVTADGARWIADCIKEYCPNAERCIDPFHVVAWANDCLDEVRKAAVRQAKQDAAEGKKAERSPKKRTSKLKSIPC